MRKVRVEVTREVAGMPSLEVCGCDVVLRHVLGQRITLTRRALSEAPKIQSIQSVVNITNRILWLNVASPMQSTMHVYEVRPRTDHRDVDLISDALPFGRLWYAEPNARGAATPEE